MKLLKDWKILWIIIVVLLIALGALLQLNQEASIDSFEECEAAGYPILEIYPRQCITPDGRTFIENISSPTGPLPSEDSDNTVCTMEAKQCPDGSWVGREGPNCKFTLCPGEK